MFSDEGAVVVAVDLHEGRGRLRFRLPARSRPAARDSRRLLPRLLHESEPSNAHRHDLESTSRTTADGFLINSVKSCNSFSAGQLLILREVEKRTGRAGGFFESDLVDPRYFSAANIKNRLESYFQMIEQKREGASASRES